jgi:hypothetical protein
MLYLIYQIGGVMMPKGQRLTDEEVTKRLLEIYPDKKIVNLAKTFKNNNGIVVYLKREANNNGITLQEYLERLGFEFKQVREYVHIVKRLLELYPNRIIDENISHYKWYRVIAVNAYKHKLTPRKYLNILGFTVKKSRSV